MSAGEFERIVRTDRLPAGSLRIEATPDERRALARRFALPAVHAIAAELRVACEGDAIAVHGRLTARFEQLCAVAAEPFDATLDEPIAIRFVPPGPPHGEDVEIEFASDEPDEVEFDGASFDLGEAMAQSFGLALDPYATGPRADEVRRAAGIADEDAPSGPFAALAQLKGGPKA